MAPFVSKTQAKHHTRSISLPSRPHSQIDEHFCRLKSSEGTSALISSRLSGLKDLYDCVDNLLLLPSTQQALAQENENCVGEVLDRSLRVLDFCGTAQDILLKTKDIAQQLQSILRRRRSDECGIVDMVGAYLASRKKAKKVICKSLKDLKSKNSICSSSNMAAASMLKDAEGFALDVFESLFLFMSGTKIQSKSTRWSLVSKLMQTKRVSCDEDAIKVSEFENVDAALFAFIGHKTCKSSTMIADNLQSELGKLESRIQDLEEGLEGMQRRLIKTRVTLLNILNN